MAPEFREFIGDNALSIDLINIGPLDDLHQPKGIIKEAQDLSSRSLSMLTIHSFLFKEQAVPSWR